MSKVRFTNTTTTALSLDLTVLSLQGQHETIRLHMAVGAHQDVTLPAGVTLPMLASAQQMKDEFARATPRFTCVALSETTLNPDLSSFELLQLTQTVAADATLRFDHTVQRAGKLGRLRLWSLAAAAAGESWVVTDILVNGVSLGLVSTAIRIAAETAALTNSDFDLADYLGASTLLVNDGDQITITADYTAGGGPTPLATIHAELTVAHGLSRPGVIDRLCL